MKKRIGFESVFIIDGEKIDRDNFERLIDYYYDSRFIFVKEYCVISSRGLIKFTQDNKYYIQTNLDKAGYFFYGIMKK